MTEGPTSINDMTLQWVAEAGQDAGVACPRCRYLLSGMQQPRCPECGEEFRVGVRLESMLDVPFVAGLIVLSLAIAPSVGMTLVFWSLVPFDWDGMIVPRNHAFMVISALQIIVWAGLIIGWCGLRRALRRRHQSLRWIAIGVFLALGVASISLLLWSV